MKRSTERILTTHAGSLPRPADLTPLLPASPDGWQMFPDMSVAEYRKYADLRVEALNHALRDIPPARVRLHVCWGSFHGPHKYDIPLRDIIDIIFKVRADGVSIEASTPRPQHAGR